MNVMIKQPPKQANKQKNQNWNTGRGILADFFLIYQGTFYIANTQIGEIEVRVPQKNFFPKIPAASHVAEDYSMIFLFFFLRKEEKKPLLFKSMREYP